ncbi:rhodanese-like domain-containing protein [Marinithermus hydrothermalis]|uniref:Rhodanese-like protein n=1 Tax=Marinithermus hydrothermalis (strain DSM 14884 / JCM 11576 / T1) TaxID=869210 RepID=F2NQ15_MARHT|nr:rhodanese-like domain-containing protein [Marinithermus hydrothermalis]AEB11116.1 Rhodanese-like protein [Marinithermus hydrothermalis DSM 14884]
MSFTQTQQITPKKAKELLDQGVPFIDVREVEEYAQARIPGAKLIPLSEFTTRVAEIPKDTPVVLYCRSGNRSAQAAAWLAMMGYRNALNLEGGILAWYRQGLPLDTQPIEAAYQATAYHELTPHEAAAWVREGAVVVDVREPFEYAMGHLPGALNIPLGQLPNRLEELPKDRRILLVCASGNRSSAACELLLEHGFAGERIGNLEGGTYAWITAGLEVER